MCFKWPWIYVKLNDVLTTQSMYSNSRDDELHGTVGIRRHQSKILPKFKKKVESQFPLTLATIHKVQGLHCHL